MILDETQYITRDNTPYEDKPIVFISYKKSDNPNLENIKKIEKSILKLYDVALWIDTNLIAGIEYDKVIEQQIESSQAVILILTSNITKSEYVWEKEIAFAKKHHKPIIPININLTGEALSQVDAKLGKIHIINYEDCNDAFVSSLEISLKVHIFQKEVIDLVKDFFESNKDKLSFKFLSINQLYLMALGLFKGIGINENKDKSINLLLEILNIKSYDEDFDSLKEDILLLVIAYCNEIDDFTCLSQYFMNNPIKSPEVIHHLFSCIRHRKKDIFRRNGIFKAILNYYIDVKSKCDVDGYTNRNSNKWKLVETKKAPKKIISDFKYGKLSTFIEKDEWYLCIDNLILQKYYTLTGPGPTNTYFIYFNKSLTDIYVISTDWCHYDIPLETSFYIENFRYFKNEKCWKCRVVANYQIKGTEALPYAPKPIRD